MCRRLHTKAALEQIDLVDRSLDTFASKPVFENELPSLIQHETKLRYAQPMLYGSHIHGQATSGEIDELEAALGQLGY